MYVLIYIFITIVVKKEACENEKTEINMDCTAGIANTDNILHSTCECESFLRHL